MGGKEDDQAVILSDLPFTTAMASEESNRTLEDEKESDEDGYVGSNFIDENEEE